MSQQSPNDKNIRNGADVSAAQRLNDLLTKRHSGTARPGQIDHAKCPDLGLLLDLR